MIVKVLRVRPLSASGSSTPEFDLSVAWKLCLPHLGIDDLEATFEPVTIVYAEDPNDEWLEPRLERELDDCLAEGKPTIIDLVIPPESPRHALVDEVVAEVLWALLLTILPSDPPKISILVDRPPRPSSAILELVEADATQEFVALTALREESGLVCHALRPRIREVFEDRLVRSRGVFQATAAGRPTTYYLYHYSAILCMPQLLDLLDIYLVENSVTRVVYGTWPGWFLAAIERACARRKIEAIRQDLLPVSATNVVGRTCFIVPARRTGQGMAELIRNSPAAWQTDACLLTVLLDRKIPKGVSMGGGAWSRTALQVDRRHLDVDYFAVVDLQTASLDHWMVNVARQADEIRDTTLAEVGVSSTGLWSLFVEVGSALETAVPRDRGARLGAVRFFPRLSAMPDEDALWLADELLRRILRETGVERENLLILIPRDENGSAPIARQLERNLMVAVARIDRDATTGKPVDTPELGYYVDSFSDQKIAILDESAVTYGTLHDINMYLSKRIGTVASTTSAVLDFGDGGAWGPTHSLWKSVPLRWQKEQQS